jgi:hypothetical protein
MAQTRMLGVVWPLSLQCWSLTGRLPPVHSNYLKNWLRSQQRVTNMAKLIRCSLLWHRHECWELFDHSPCSADLALSDYRLFIHTYLKNWLRSQQTWLNSYSAHFYGTDANAGSCLTTLLAALISLWATTACSFTPIWRTDWDNNKHG